MEQERQYFEDDVLMNNQVLVFYGNNTEFREADCLPFLSEKELKRTTQFLHKSDSRSYIISRAIIRQLISRFLQIDEKEIEFCFGRNGKPFLKNNPSLRFNVSHTGDEWVIGFANGMEIGVDIEPLDRNVNVRSLKNYLFTARELQHFDSVPAEQKQVLFIKSWTKKEALLKASGSGLTNPMNALDIAFMNDRYFSLKTEQDDFDKERRCFLESKTIVHSVPYHLSVAVSGEVSGIRYININEAAFNFIKQKSDEIGYKGN